MTCIDLSDMSELTSGGTLHPQISMQYYFQNKMFFFKIVFISHIIHTSTEHKTASLADEDNSAYCQSSGSNNIKHINL